uniref:Lipocalin n=1 Tax=Rhipicephalus appendiculatus TaxID=34631 RepID=A0A131YFE1_RHIAP
MIASVAVILCTFVFCAATDDSASCNRNTDDQTRMNGYDFLQPNCRVFLVATSMESIFKLKDGTQIECISAVTNEKLENTHTVMETVDYKNASSNEWERFSQWYTFEPQSGTYNHMKITELNGAPQGIYKFLLTTQGCAVVEVKEYTFREDVDEEVTVVQERTDGSGSNGKPHCMMWEKEGNTDATQTCCEPFFRENCKEKKRAYQYTPRKCEVPKYEDDSEL